MHQDKFKHPLNVGDIIAYVNSRGRILQGQIIDLRPNNLRILLPDLYDYRTQTHGHVQRTTHYDRIIKL